MQIDAAQHFVLTERFAQAANGQRQPARDFRTAPCQPRLFEEVRELDGLGIRQKKTKGFLHLYSQCFWNAGCQDSVSRSSTREALSASFPSNA